YLKYLEPLDLATYLPGPQIWDYESNDKWWTLEPTRERRALMAAEIKSIRQHKVLTDSDILDIIGDETLERDLPLEARVRLRASARKAAREARPFRDTDMFNSVRSPDGTWDLVDDLVNSVSL